MRSPDSGLLPLGNKLFAEMRAAGLNYSETHKVFAGESTFDFADPAEFAEWQTLENARVTPTVPMLVDVRTNSDNEFEDQ